MVVVPTTYDTVKISELVSHNIKMVIYANQTLRTAHMAMKELLQKMIKAESISEFDEELKEGIKWLDGEARRKNISFYDMVFEVLYKHDMAERAKEWNTNRN